METALAVITIGTCVKDLVELGQKIKDSIEKVRENKEQLSKLKDNVDETVNGLAKLDQGFTNARPSAELSAALDDLKNHLEKIHDKCERASQHTSWIKSWWKRDKIDREIKRLKDLESDCLDEFQLFCAARTEGKVDQLGGATARIETDIKHIARKTDQITDTAARIEDNTIQIKNTTVRIDKGTIQIAETTARTEHTTVLTAHTTARIEHTTDQVQVSVLRRKLEEWLQNPPSMKKRQDDTQELQHEGTGSWFLNGPQFGEWKDKPGALWIRGNTGTGKSVLSSVVIRTLFSDRQQRTAVAYFYFDFRDERSQSAKIMLHSIILQLSAQSFSPYSALDQLHKSSEGQTLPTYQNLLDILDELLSDFVHTYIVLDALDECTENDRLVQFIIRLRDWTQRSLHLLFTSQPRDAFMKAFEDVSLVVLSPDITRHDIKRFVDSELPKLSHLSRRSEEIIEKVVMKSNGMFRLAACLLIELRDAFSPDLDAILAQLPDDLFGIYSRFLKRIHPTALVYISAVLRWLSFSHRPVTLTQLEDAVAFNFSGPGFVYDPRRRGGNAERVVKMLEGMVHLNVNSRGSIVSLAHASVADYLESDRFTQEYPAYDLRTGPSHRFLAQSCLGYLLHFADHPLTDARQAHYPLGRDAAENWYYHYPLGGYAAENWYRHLHQSDDPTLLSHLVTDVLQSENSLHTAFHTLRRRPQWASFNVLRVDGWSYLYKALDYGETTKPLQPLSVCSELGYSLAVHFLLQNGADPNNDDLLGFTALQLASKQGHIDIVRQLLEYGAQADQRGNKTAHPAIRMACDRGHTEIVRLLLQHGAAANPMGGDDNPLHIAADKGYTEIVRLLLAHGAEINATGGAYSSAGTMDRFSPPYRGSDHTNPFSLLLRCGKANALHFASQKGHIDVVRLLLDNGAEINTAGTSALHIAAKHDDTEMVRLLLAHGAEINATCGEFGSALSVACAEGHMHIDTALLDANNAIDSALLAEAKKGCTATVRLLLDKGANVNGVGGKHGSVLRAAAKNGCTEIVRLLLDKGAEINSGGKCGSTLDVAAEKSHREIVQVLLDKDAVVSAGGKYDSVLYIAAKKGNTEIVQLLLDKGAEVNASGEHGNALYIAAEKGHTEIVQLLIDKGADVNAGGEYGSALQAASWGCHIEAVRLLLEKGADVNADSGECGSALEIASRFQFDWMLKSKSEKEKAREIVQILLDHGAHPEDAEDTDGSEDLRENSDSESEK
ncbi:HET-domain-containing protein [Mycena venus]|uniref:HET-domain-containing protein n=1 Tax=Mycena venus TaxID=2733690 RepID=A0A8H6XMY9_9AGAR|nr:HET-domain-containing protein [Mycena venus]